MFNDFEGASDWLEIAGPETMYVQTEVANIRADPNTNAPIVGKAARADEVNVLSRSESWVKVVIPASDWTVGWIHASLLASEAP